MLRRSLKQIYYSLGYASGAAERRIRKLERERKAAVLNLHRVSPGGSDYWPPMPPELFEELLQFLTEKFEVRRVSELAENSSKRPVAALSFDDGYYDFIEYALPLLEKYRVPANMNVIPACAMSGKPIWNVQLYDFLHASSRNEINRLDIPGFVIKLDSDTPMAKARFGVALSRHLKNRPRKDRVEIWESIETLIAEHSGERTRMMTTKEISSIGDKVDLGVHSFSHESMAFEADGFFEEDLERCREYFANDLERPLSIYAFPNGSHRPEQIERLRRAGVKQILLVGEKPADPKSDVLERITMYGDSGREVKMRALGF